MNPTISVVICTYNRAESLRAALGTVVTQDAGEGQVLEVVVVDDHSTDHTASVVHELAAQYPAVRLAPNNRAKGIAGARNAGVTAARGDWIVFFDDDQLADPGWIAALLEAAQASSAKIIGGARRLDLSPETLGRLGPVCRSLLGENLYEGEPVPMRGKDLPTTGNLLIARAVFDAVGLFDENLTISSGEDAELIGRARAADFQVWTAPRAVVAHMIPAYRTTPAYFRWVSLRWGIQFAQIDSKRKGLSGMVVRAAARAAQAWLLHLPRWVLARLRGDVPAAMDARCLLWRAEGYLRKSLFILLPNLFAQAVFLRELEFRNERQLFGGS